MLYRPNTRWTWIFFLSIFLEAVVLIILEMTLYLEFMGSLADIAENVTSTRVAPTFFALVTLGLLYQLILVYDTLAHHNSIQVLGLSIYSATLCIYNGLQLTQVRDAYGILYDNSAIDPSTGQVILNLAITIIAVTAVSTIWTIFSAWKLSGEFAWIIFHKVEADITMQRRYVYFELLISILKFDGFYFIGFLVQLVTVITIRSDAEFAATIAIIPFSCSLLFITASVVRHERRWGTISVCVLHCALEGFFIFKITRLYSPETYGDYLPARRSLILFGVMAIILSNATMAMIILCSQNFHQGLRPYITGEREAFMLGEGFEMQLYEGYSPMERGIS